MSVKARLLLLVVYSHAIKVSCVKISAFGIVHPSDLVPVLRRLRADLYPLVKIRPYGCHFLIKLDALLGHTIEDVLVDPKDCFMDSRIDLVELDDVYEGLNVRPLALSWVTSLFVSKSPELTSGAWELHAGQHKASYSIVRQLTSTLISRSAMAKARPSTMLVDRSRQ
jgi:hypothetical protein